MDIDEEVPFAIDEVFYSRTDARGVLLAGNAVFQRVAGYPWASLIGAPHRIVRHKATPRAVFRILWLLIERQEPAVAFICNRAQDGRYYWVLATVLPFGGGYLSVRVKPSSAVFGLVKALYADLVAAEEGGLSIEGSVEMAVARLREAGYASYRDFMRRALWDEITARRLALGHGPDPWSGEVVQLRSSLTAALSEQDALRAEFERMRILPTNMRILASRIEPEGGPLSAIAGIYLSVSADIFGQIEKFFLGPESLVMQMSERFEKAVFLNACAALQAELAASSAHGDVKGSGIDQVKEARYLGELGKSCDDQAMAGLEQATQFASAIAAASAGLRRSLLSLETVTVMGRVECARMEEAGIRVAATIDLLRDLNTQISALLEKITGLTATISTGLCRIRDGDARRRPALGRDKEAERAA